MINPPIDKLIEKVGCKFALVCLVSKRAHIVAEKYSGVLEELNDTALTYAAKDIYESRIEAAPYENI
ncbi:MAG: DNA-directed RNA polymerase subunit omega [Firmicutes bacterium]|nr:DNA-directed RNA polymerase subunit omega [Bacillota bacterium]